MPTSSRLIAAVLFGLVAFFTAEAFKLKMPEGTQFGQFTLLCTGIGMICGWLIMGRLVGRGYGTAAATGVRVSVSFTAWALLVCSIILMVRKAFKQRYASPTEAVIDIVALALENGLRLFSLDVLGILFLGGILGGLVAEWARQRWD